MIYLVSALLGYLFGSIPFSFVIAKLLKGIDLREYGSRNVGATNVIRSVGLFPGIIAGILDLTKAIIPPLILRSFGVGPKVELLSGFFAVVGHNWPIYLGFRGGRGIGCTIGLLFFYFPREAALFMLISLVFALLRESALGIFVAFTTLFIYSHFKFPPIYRNFVTVLYLLMLIRRVSFVVEDRREGYPILKSFVMRFFFDSREKKKLKPAWKEGLEKHKRG